MSTIDLQRDIARREHARAAEEALGRLLQCLDRYWEADFRRTLRGAILARGETAGPAFGRIEAVTEQLLDQAAIEAASADFRARQLAVTAAERELAEAIDRYRQLLSRPDW